MTDNITPEELAEIAAEKFALLESLEDRQAQELLTESDHAFEFTVPEGGAFVVDVRDGEVTTHVGESDREDSEITTVTGDAETIGDVLMGETTIVDEVWDSNVQAQVYGVGMEDTSWLSRMLKRIRHEEGKFIPRGRHTYGPYDR